MVKQSALKPTRHLLGKKTFFEEIFELIEKTEKSKKFIFFVPVVCTLKKIYETAL